MPNELIRIFDTVTVNDLRFLAHAHPPCITITAPSNTPFDLTVHLKNALRDTEKELAASEAEEKEIQLLLAPVREMATAAETERLWHKNLILFRSPDMFRVQAVFQPVREGQSIGEWFVVRPLLSALTREQTLHLLCLSVRQVRLLYCKPDAVEEEEIPAFMPRSLDDWLHNRHPDHLLENRASAGPGQGSMKAVRFGTSTFKDREEEYVRHFFEEVDKGLNALLRRDMARLLLAGAQEEVALYRRISRYPEILEDAIYGSPDGMRTTELNKRAMEILGRCRSHVFEQALANVEKYGGTNRITGDPRLVVAAARDGRIENLFFEENTVLAGFTPANAAREDQLNAAALQTVMHGGSAFVVAQNEMPFPAGVAAVLRY